MFLAASSVECNDVRAGYLSLVFHHDDQHVLPPSWPRKIKWLNKHLPPPVLGEQHDPGFGIGIKEKVLSGFLLLYCLVHLLVPLRHWLYPGDPSWTKEGHQFAWRMMLRSKNGSLNFYVQDPASNGRKSIKIRDYLTSEQYRDMLGKPDMILQFAHFLREAFKNKYKGEIEVYARCRISLNGKPPQEIIRQDINLAKEKRSLAHYEWILLLNN